MGPCAKSEHIRIQNYNDWYISPFRKLSVVHLKGFHQLERTLKYLTDKITLGQNEWKCKIHGADHS